jgi:hypothetical protein
MTTIQLTLTLDETNVVLEAVGQLPYARVYTLVAKIQQQASTQLQEEQHLTPEKNSQNGKLIESTGGLK